MKDLDRSNLVFFGIGTGVAALVSSLVYFTSTTLLSGQSIFFSIKYVKIFRETKKELYHFDPNEP
jgi:hypothetical protein